MPGCSSRQSFPSLPRSAGEFRSAPFIMSGPRGAACQAPVSASRPKSAKRLEAPRRRPRALAPVENREAERGRGRACLLPARRDDVRERLTLRAVIGSPRSGNFPRGRIRCVSRERAAAVERPEPLAVDERDQVEAGGQVLEVSSSTANVTLPSRRGRGRARSTRNHQPAVEALVPRPALRLNACSNL